MRTLIILILITLSFLFLIHTCNKEEETVKYTHEEINLEIDSLKDIKSDIDISLYIDSIDSLKNKRHIVHEDIDTTQMGSYIENTTIVNTLDIMEYQDTLIDSLIYIKKIDSTIIHNLEIKEGDFKAILKEKDKEIKKIKRKNIFIIIGATIVGVMSIILIIIN